MYLIKHFHLFLGCCAAAAGSQSSSCSSCPARSQGCGATRTGNCRLAVCCMLLTKPIIARKMLILPKP
jgi:hypothetical protein